MAQKAHRHKFPKQLFVHVENPTSNDEFYSADETIDQKEGDAEVAIYELREVKRMKVTKELR